VPVEGGSPRLLVRFDDPQRPSLRREFATDGVRFFFTIAQDESDVWIAQVSSQDGAHPALSALDGAARHPVA